MHRYVTSISKSILCSIKCLKISFTKGKFGDEMQRK